MAVAAPPFAGFSRDAIQFLADLAVNNDRAWFQPRKADYERLLKEPLAAFVAAVGERLAARGVPLLADPGRSPFRIYRDVRFSKDKSPYKTNVGASFPWVERGAPPVGAAQLTREDRHGVGGYFHLQPGEMFFGGGMWHPERPRLEAFRRRVVADPAGTLAVLEDPRFVAVFSRLDGEALRRVPPGLPADHPQAELLKLKDVVFARRLSDDEALSPDLPDVVADGFAVATPVLRLLASLRR